MQCHQNQIEMQSVTDRHLVTSAKQGDADAFAELVKRHTRRVFSVAWHLTHSREDAEDITQETFLKACCHLRDFQEKAQFSTWLTRIAVNTALTKIRSSKSAPICADGEPIWESMSEELSDWRSNPEELYSRSQLRQRLQEALKELPQIYSKVFVLREMYGFSVAETAAALQLTVPTVKTRLLRARLQLRDNLRKSFLPTWTEAEHARSNLVARVRPLALDCSSLSHWRSSHQEL